VAAPRLTGILETRFVRDELGSRPMPSLLVVARQPGATNSSIATAVAQELDG
jgi:hypothetical protein